MADVIHGEGPNALLTFGNESAVVRRSFIRRDLSSKEDLLRKIAICPAQLTKKQHKREISNTRSVLTPERKEHLHAVHRAHSGWRWRRLVFAKA
jgi:hypothetical protein